LNPNRDSDLNGNSIFKINTILNRNQPEAKLERKKEVEVRGGKI
jgi:hypothetical protein